MERRTNAVRRAVSTARIIDATIASLFKLGYGATSVSVVVEAAKTSRGAFLHHFPSKADLMLAVIKHAWDVDQRYYRTWISKHPDPRERFANIVEPAWRALSRPTGIAVLEILIASRSDAALAALVVPAQLQVHVEVLEFLQEKVGNPIGLTPERTESFFRFLEAALRGLAVSQMITKDAVSATPTLEHIRDEAARILAKPAPRTLETPPLPAATERLRL